MSRSGVFVLVLIAAAVAFAWWGDWLDDAFDPETIRAAVLDAGIWGPALFIAIAMASFTIFLLAPVVWVSVALWPIPEAFAYSFAASVLASFITYAATFALGRDWARTRIPERLIAWEQRLEARPVFALVTLRSLLWANPLVDILVAVSRVPPRAYLVGTILGLIGPTAFQVGVAAGGGALLGRLFAHT